MDENKLSLTDGGFEWDGAIASSIFPDLRLMAAEIWAMVE
jgi:hypothetical protein